MLVLFSSMTKCCSQNHSMRLIMLDVQVSKIDKLYYYC